MNHAEFNRLFAVSIEKERVALGYTQEQMSEALELTLSSYKRIVRGDTEKIDLYLSYKMYELTKRLSYELVGYSDTFVDVITGMKMLSAEELLVVDQLVKLLTFSRTYTDKHKRLFSAYNNAAVEDRKQIDRMLGENE